MSHIEDVLLWAIAQNGDRYVFGAEVPLTATDSDKWDCSELVQWSCARAGVRPEVADGAVNQWNQCRNAGTMLSLPDGYATRGALLFSGDGKGTGRDAIFHVAFSLGDGTTVEARGAKWGVGTWPVARRFTFAAKIPNVDYSSGRTPQNLPQTKSPPYPGLTKIGSTGDPARQVQQRLRDRGWKLQVTGTFDQDTDTIVRKFQQEKGLAVDGKVGENTWAALWNTPIT